jgi:hypothetical protein
MPATGATEARRCVLCDGHLTNATAFARDDLDGVVYHRTG